MTTHLYPHMVHTYYLNRVRALLERRAETLAQIKTRAAAQRYRDDVKRKVHACFAPLPQRTPLNTQVVSERRLDDDVILEKLRYESRPGHFVTANLYRPAGGRGPFPAVLGTCGHAEEGKAALPYQSFSRTLARKGYVALIFDPISQGERDQYGPGRGRWQPRGCCQQHNMAGKQMSLLGNFFGTWRAWDAIRSLDVLLDRPEVDPGRVGVTGNSGGGTLSTYLNALDDRLTMAAPSCFITSYLHNLANELPADSEQVPPTVLGQGLDMADFIIAQVPRPTLLIGQERDFFDVRGLRQAYAEAKRIYALLGHEDHLQLHVGPGGHGYHQDGREAMYGFFNRVAGRRAARTEPPLTPLPTDQLHVAPDGQVRNLPGNRYVHDITADAAEALRQSRGRVSAAALRKRLPEVLNLPPRCPAPPMRVLRPGHFPSADRYSRVWRFALTTEPNIETIVQVWDNRELTPSEAYLAGLPRVREATVYLPHIDSEDDVRRGQTDLPGMAAPDLLFTLDPRGIGQSTALTCNDRDYFASYGSDYFNAALGQMLGESYLGRRVHDVLAVLDEFEAHGITRIHLVGRGLGAVIAALAGCLHRTVRQVTLRHALLSFYELTQSPVFGWPLSVLPWDGLRAFDLPDCYRALASKDLRIVEPWDARMAKWRPAALARHLADLGIDAAWVEAGERAEGAKGAKRALAAAAAV